MTAAIFRKLGMPTRGSIVVVCDHASNAVPEGIEFERSVKTLQKHIAYDIGAAGVVERLARRHDIPAFTALWSRLVVDLHREEEADGVIPTGSDGILIPGNIGANREARLNQYYRPYHDALEAWLNAA